ncbi:hypothetical protein, partial [Limnoraphis robusta]|uniref:hypothetical protein n=1 Tax=Limnoraphis robusta TaxID=1118279 RepID=UPI001F3758CB
RIQQIAITTHPAESSALQLHLLTRLIVLPNQKNHTLILAYQVMKLGLKQGQHLPLLPLTESKY